MSRFSNLWTVGHLSNPKCWVMEDFTRAKYHFVMEFTLHSWRMCQVPLLLLKANYSNVGSDKNIPNSYTDHRFDSSQYILDENTPMMKRKTVLFIYDDWLDYRRERERTHKKGVRIPCLKVFVPLLSHNKMIDAYPFIIYHGRLCNKILQNLSW